MHQEHAIITRSEEIAANVFILQFDSENISRIARAGQFLNIKPDFSFDPLLRRAYSIHRVQGSQLEIVYSIVGKGSAIFAAKRPGDSLDILGPLGVPFHLDDDFQTGILVSGGLGIAPMPFLGDTLAGMGKEVVNIHGARTGAMIANDGRLLNPRYATDDGSFGFHGNVVQALEQYLEEAGDADVKVFSCGPNRMMEALGNFCTVRGLRLEVSLECQMACGIGICQGCPVEMKTGEKKYSLVCTHGPNYDINDIALESLPLLH